MSIFRLLSLRSGNLRAYSIQVIGFIGALWLLASQSIEQSANDPGLGWHLATGQWITTLRTVPQKDPFLFFSSPQPWIADQWLADLLLYITYSLGAFPLLCSALTALFMVTYIGILFRFVTRHQASLIPAALSVFVAFKVALIHFVIRPVPLSFFLFALLFTNCVNVYRSNAPLHAGRGNTTKTLLAFVLIFVAWANIHPSFAIGLCVIASAACFALFEDSSTPQARRTNAKTILLAACALSCAAVLINPYGIRILDTLFSSSQWTDITSEWKPIDLAQPEGTLLALALAIITFAYARYSTARQQISRLEIFLVIVFGAASLHAVRMVPYFGIVAALPLAISLNELTRQLLRRPDSISPPLQAQNAVSGIGLVSGLSFALLLFTYRTHSIPFFDNEHKLYSPSPHIFPLDALARLSDIVAPQESKGVLVEPDWGGAVTWYGGGRLRPTIDDRDVLFRLQDYRDNAALLSQSTPDAVFDYMDRKHVRLLLVRTLSPLSERAAQDPRFKLIYRDNTAIAFSISTQ